MAIHPLWDDRSRITKMNNSLSLPLIKGGITSSFNKRHERSAERMGGIICNSKGISILFLVIALLLMVTAGYVISYLIPTKQKSIIFPINSTQAFFIAQSGVEYAIRYCSDQGWRRASDGAPSRLDLSRLNDVGNNQRTLGNGTFTIYYQNTTAAFNAATDILTSTGQITGSSENRVVRVSNFSTFLRLVFDTASPAPCRTVPNPIPGGLTRNRTARFYIQNVRSTNPSGGLGNVTLTAFSATWTHSGGGGSTLQRIYMNQGAGWVYKYNGNYNSGTLPPVNFNRPFGGPFTQIITPGQTITVLLYLSTNWGGGSPIINFTITFYTAAGDGYTFDLDAAGTALPAC